MALEGFFMSEKIFNKLLAARPGLAVCWLGNLGWLIARNGRLVAFDLDLDSSMRRALPPLSAEELAPVLDTVFITHQHGDHFNEITGRKLAARSGCRFVVPASCLEKARIVGLPEDRTRVARPGEPFDLDDLHVEPLRAIHGDRNLAVYSGANLDDCGYVLTVAGLRLLQPGDSLLTDTHLSQAGIDVLFVSPTGHNMLIEPAAKLITTIRPRHIFPQHFDTYAETADNSFWTHGYPDELCQALPPDMRRRYHKLAQGEVFVVGPAK
jgi:L-ascorbate 6-phosphate lactonase